MSDDAHVVVFGIDGLRHDMIRAHAPHLTRLIDTGYYATSTLPYLPTVSGPGWASTVTGVWPEKHGIWGNDFTGHRLVDYPDFLTRLESVDPGARTYAAVDWDPLGAAACGGPMITNSGRRFVLADCFDTGDRQVAADAASHLRSESPDASFVYFGQIDEAGHAFDSVGPQYTGAITTVDGYVEQVLAAVRSRPRYDAEGWLFLLVTDHGHRPEGDHGGDSLLERSTFVSAWGEGITRTRPAMQPHNVDVAVTALTHLGVPIDPSWHLDGHPLPLGGPSRTTLP
ncbi:alkaline phosphatase family protein [Pseudonocardia sp. GCM10023141]|uniref:alkaline phosphatase family protein n=1 Tax=Pseudonocardia sp. GCM10023141 TaxID=3252653 RepID=UPI00360C809F